MASEATTNPDRSPARKRRKGSGCCPRCGHSVDVLEEPVVRRGALVLRTDPLSITWRDLWVPLSNVEAEVFAHVMRKGRTTFEDIDRVMDAIGASSATRSIVILRIRAKLRKLGACDPFERQGHMLRLRVDPEGSTGVVVGLRMTKHVVAEPERAGVGLA